MDSGKTAMMPTKHNKYFNIVIKLPYEIDMLYFDENGPGKNKALSIIKEADKCLSWTYAHIFTKGCGMATGQHNSL